MSENEDQARKILKPHTELLTVRKDGFTVEEPYVPYWDAVHALEAVLAARPPVSPQAAEVTHCGCDLSRELPPAVHILNHMDPPVSPTPAPEHPAHNGHEYGGAFARSAALAGGDPDWMNATGGTPAPTEDDREALIAALRAFLNDRWKDVDEVVIVRGTQAPGFSDDLADAVIAGFARRSTPVETVTTEQMVRAFHENFGLPISVGRTTTVRHGDLVALRKALLKEEHREYRDAEDAGDVVAIADALGDMLYVIYGTAITYGIPLDAVVQEIHRSNMTKMPGPTGKAIKGPDYSPPDLLPVLFRPNTEGDKNNG